MSSACVLITTEIGSEEEVRKNLQKIRGVKEAHVVYGVYDVVARVEAEKMDKLKTILTGEIRRVEGIRSTIDRLASTNTEDDNQHNR